MALRGALLLVPFLVASQEKGLGGGGAEQPPEVAVEVDLLYSDKNFPACRFENAGKFLYSLDTRQKGENRGKK